MEPACNRGRIITVARKNLSRDRILCDSYPLMANESDEIACVYELLSFSPFQAQRMILPYKARRGGEGKTGQFTSGPARVDGTAIRVVPEECGVIPQMN